MPSIMAVTLVQKKDLPWAYASLESIKRVIAPESLKSAGAMEIGRLVLLNDEGGDAIEARLGAAAGGEVIVAGRNLGVAGGRNMLVREAAKRGAEFVLSIDDDILLPPDFVKILWKDYEKLRARDGAPGILTPATLDFHSLRHALFDDASLKTLSGGGFVATDATDKIVGALREGNQLKAESIYHMGIVDWRGAYLFSNAGADRRIQSAYGVKASEFQGEAASFRKAPGAAEAILSGADPIEIDTAPGGICFFSTKLFADIGGVDEIFNPFGYEDSDFALRAKAAGYRHYCIPRAVAIHDIALRLRLRDLAVTTAAQGKMASIFARRHVEGTEAVASFMASARRAIHDISAASTHDNESSDQIPSLNRLSALLAYCANSALYLLPDCAGADAPDSKAIAEIIDTLVGRLYRIQGPDRENVDNTNLPRGVATSQTPDESTRRIFRRDAAGDVVADITVLPMADQQRVKVVIETLRLRAPRDLAPALLRALSGEGDCLLTISGTITLAEQGMFSVDDLVARILHGALLRGALQGRRFHENNMSVAKIVIEEGRFELWDQGSLPRVVHALSEIDNTTAVELVQTYQSASHEENLAALFVFLRGDVDAVSFSFNGSLDGTLGAPRLEVRSSPVAHAAANEAQQWFLKSGELPMAGHQSPGKPETAPSLPPTMTTRLGGAVTRLFQEDRKIAPFPDAYNPGAATKFARKIRYIAVSRGVPLTRSEARMHRFRGYGAGRRAFIIGNGPSLNKLDLTLLKDEVTFGVNAIYLHKEKMGFLPTHYIVEDVFVAEDRAKEINALKGPTKWFGNYLRYCLRGDENTCWLNVACDYTNYPDFPNFSQNTSRIIWVGGTVSYLAMQIAFYMGFSQVYLIGFDHSYTIPKDASVEGRTIISKSDDPNHFHPEYFGKGYRWHDPRVDRMEMAYHRARDIFESHHRKIFNATHGGQLEVFERTSYESLFPQNLF